MNSDLNKGRNAVVGPVSHGTTLSLWHHVFVCHTNQLAKQDKVTCRPGAGRDPASAHLSGHRLSPVRHALSRSAHNVIRLR